MTTQRQRFVHALLAWMIATILVLSVLNAFSYELFLSVSLLGLLILTELTAPVTVRPEWRTRLRWLLLAGILGFAVLVVRRILEILPSGLLP